MAWDPVNLRDPTGRNYGNFKLIAWSAIKKLGRSLLNAAVNMDDGETIADYGARTMDPLAACGSADGFMSAEARDGACEVAKTAAVVLAVEVGTGALASQAQGRPRTTQSSYAIYRKVAIPGGGFRLTRSSSYGGVGKGGKRVRVKLDHRGQGLPPKGTPPGEAARYDRYRRNGGPLKYEEWYPRSRGGRSGGPEHKAMQERLVAQGYKPEKRFGDRYADAFKKGEIHQIGGLNKRGDPIARERDAINDMVSSSEYRNETIYFWDKANPQAPPIVDPHKRPTWGDRQQ